MSLKHSKISKRYKRLAEVYSHYGRQMVGDHADFSPVALLAMYKLESYGGNINDLLRITNGYAIGKQWMDWHFSNWGEGIKERTLFAIELIEDAEIPFIMRQMVFRNWGKKDITVCNKYGEPVADQKLPAGEFYRVVDPLTFNWKLLLLE